MKYVVVRLRGIEIPILFPSYMSHEEASRGHEAVSGGFILLMRLPDGGIEVKAYGESVSLNLPSRPEDSALLTTELLR